MVKRRCARRRPSAKGCSRMPIDFTAEPSRRSLPVHIVRKGRLGDAGLDAVAVTWAEANDFSGEAGRLLTLPGSDGAMSGALFGIGNGDDPLGALAFGGLSKLPKGDWHFAVPPADPTLAAIGLKLGAYAFTR